MYGAQRRFFDDTCANERTNDSNDIDRQLKLKKFRNWIVDIATPHHCFDDGIEIVVDQNNIRRFFGNIRTLDTLDSNTDHSSRMNSSLTYHGEPNVGFFQSRTIVRSITSHGNDFPCGIDFRRNDASNKNEFVLRGRTSQDS